MTATFANKPSTYNGLHEVALRSLVSIHVFGRRGMSGSELRLVEFFAVFGRDVGMDTSLQYPHEGRGNAHGFRLDMILPALRYLVDIGLVEANGDEADVETGCDWQKIVPARADITALFSDPYLLEFRRVCDHMRAQAKSVGRGRYFERLRVKVADLKQTGVGTPPVDPKFDWLRINYGLDAARMRGLAHGAAFLAGLDPTRRDEALAVAEAAEAEVRKTGVERVGLDRLRTDLAASAS